MQYRPHDVGPRYCNPPHPHYLPLLCASQMVQGGVVLSVQFQGQDEALSWSPQSVQSPVETKVSGR